MAIVFPHLAYKWYSHGRSKTLEFSDLENRRYRTVALHSQWRMEELEDGTYRLSEIEMVGL
jgi:hypothetical protein